MDVLINFATGLKTNQTTLEGRTASTRSGQGMDTCGMTWIALPVISTHARKVNEPTVTIPPRGPLDIVLDVSSYAWKCKMKQTQCIKVAQFHLALSRQTRALRRAVFSGEVLYDSTINCRFCHWFTFVFITFPSPDCHKGMGFFVFIDNCGGQQFNLLNNSRPLPLLGDLPLHMHIRLGKLYLP